MRNQRFFGSACFCLVSCISVAMMIAWPQITLAQGRGWGRGQRHRGGWQTPSTAPPTAQTRPSAPTTRPSPSTMGPGFGRGRPEFVRLFHSLLDDHLGIKRTVEDIPGGVLTVTTSDDPRIAANIRLHVRQMKERTEAGLVVRPWDPLFVELSRNHAKMVLAIEDVPGGVKVTHTSDDPNVVLLIRQHAHRGVSEFVKQGWPRMPRETPLPEGYRKP